jgi:Kef-type K+ transport system membrane component KefB
MNIYYEAAIWIGIAFLAALVSIRISIPVALVEAVIGAIAANIPGIKEQVTETEFVTFLAGVGSIALTFLAGAEIDPVSMKRHWKPSLAIGVVSFAIPFFGAFGISTQQRSVGWHFLRHPSRWSMR